MSLKFTKMHGLGNDFVVFDAINQSVVLSSETIRAISNRRFGVGCDQLLLVENPSQADVDFRYRIFNADGSEVEQCGNGARCFARFVRDQGLTDKDSIVVETAGGIITLDITADGQVTVNMGVPRFAVDALPMKGAEVVEGASNLYHTKIADRVINFSAVSMGNPHITLLVDDLDNYPVEEIGPLLESHHLFPNRVNVGFMQILDRQHVKLRVFERGSGETLACGTGACGAVANGITRGLLDSDVEVALPGGKLHIRWQGNSPQSDDVLWMTGPATRVFDGVIEPDMLILNDDN